MAHPDAGGTPERDNAPRNQAELESRIAAAWQHLASQPQEWIRMARIRALLDNPDQGLLRQTLITMIRTGTVHLAPDSNRKVLTDADHAAAIDIGGEPKHLLTFEADYFDDSHDDSDGM